MYEKTGELLVDIGSDQTSCHDIRGGGYLPIELTAEEAKTYIGMGNMNCIKRKSQRKSFATLESNERGKIFGTGESNTAPSHRRP